MKVVLFCGGLGMRLREYSEVIPKPMVPIGYRPILWHVMKYYAYYGHKDFILCLGYRGDSIKKYFLDYDECLTNNFVLSGGGKKLELLHSDIQDWRITFVDTGLTSNVGQRLRAVREHVAGEEMFLGNYTDCLSDVNLEAAVETLRASQGAASFVGVKPTATFHLIDVGPNGIVRRIDHVAKTGVRINGGFFVFRQEIFEHMKDGEELVEEPFHRLIQAGKLVAHPHEGFWACMDTFKEKQELEDIYAQGRAPWAVWNGKDRSST